MDNDTVVKKIVGALDLKKEIAVIEIGPGRGALTFPVADACRAAGCRLVAIEKDPALANGLARAIAESEIGAVEIITGDALNILSAAITDATKTDQDYSVVGNIPYYITGKLLRILSETEIKPRQCVFMVQKEVAERICAEPPTMNRLAASVQFWADAKTIAVVPKKDFIPPPEVDSAVIVLTKKSRGATSDADRYYRTVRALFAQPRKTILNNISASKPGLPKHETEMILKKIGVAVHGRPQDLSVEKITALARALWG